MMPREKKLTKEMCFKLEAGDIELLRTAADRSGCSMSAVLRGLIRVSLRRQLTDAGIIAFVGKVAATGDGDPLSPDLALE